MGLIGKSTGVDINKNMAKHAPAKHPMHNLLDMPKIRKWKWK